MDEGMVGFVIGVILGALIAVGGFRADSQYRLDKCAEEHNIYQCEWISVPIKSKE